MLRIRLQNKYKCGKGYFGYHISVLNTKTSRDGSPIEKLGYYEASFSSSKHAKLYINWSRLVYWLGKGVLFNKSVLKVLKSSSFFEQIIPANGISNTYKFSKKVHYIEEFSKNFL